MTFVMFMNKIQRSSFGSTCLGAKLWTLLSIFPVVYCLIEMGSPKYIWTFPKSSFKIFLAFNKACKIHKTNEINLPVHVQIYIYIYIHVHTATELHSVHICFINDVHYMLEKNVRFWYFHTVESFKFIMANFCSLLMFSKGLWSIFLWILITVHKMNKESVL